MPKAPLKVSYLPNGSFVLPIISALNGSKKPEVRALASKWQSSGLGVMGASLSTKVTMLGLLSRRLHQHLTPLVVELGQNTDVPALLSGGYVWLPSQRQLPYEVLLEFDSYVFEFRSAYELLGHFMKAFAQHVLQQPVKESDLVDILKARGIATKWAEDLKAHRILFFHEQAPWLAFRVSATEPFDPEPLFLIDVDADPNNPEQTITMLDLSRSYGGFDAALRELQAWAIKEIGQL